MGPPGRYVCTAAAPWRPDLTPDPARRVSHPDAREVGDRDYGLGCYCAVYLCPHCGQRFEVELPQ